MSPELLGWQSGHVSDQPAPYVPLRRRQSWRSSIAHRSLDAVECGVEVERSPHRRSGARLLYRDSKPGPHGPGLCVLRAPACDFRSVPHGPARCVLNFKPPRSHRLLASEFRSADGSHESTDFGANAGGTLLSIPGGHELATAAMSLAARGRQIEHER